MKSKWVLFLIVVVSMFTHRTFASVTINLNASIGPPVMVDSEDATGPLAATAQLELSVPDSSGNPGVNTSSARGIGIISGTSVSDFSIIGEGRADTFINEPTLNFATVTGGSAADITIVTQWLVSGGPDQGLFNFTIGELTIGPGSAVGGSTLTGGVAGSEAKQLDPSVPNGSVFTTGAYLRDQPFELEFFFHAEAAGSSDGTESDAITTFGFGNFHVTSLTGDPIDATVTSLMLATPPPPPPGAVPEPSMLWVALGLIGCVGIRGAAKKWNVFTS